MGAQFIPEKLTDLVDIDTSFPADGNVLVYNESTGKYTPQAPSSGGKAISFTIPGDAFVTSNIVRIVIGTSITVSKVRLAVVSAPTGADLIIDVNKNGSTMFTTQANRPKIVAGAVSGVSVAPDITSLVEDDKLSIDIDQVGSTLVGTTLSITIIGT